MNKFWAANESFSPLHSLQKHTQKGWLSVAIPPQCWPQLKGKGCEEMPHLVAPWFLSPSDEGITFPDKSERGGVWYGVSFSDCHTVAPIGQGAWAPKLCSSYLSSSRAFCFDSPVWLPSTFPLWSCSVSFDEPAPTFAALDDLLIYLSAPHLQNGMTILHFENLRLESLSNFRKHWWGSIHPPTQWFPSDLILRKAMALTVIMLILHTSGHEVSEWFSHAETPGWMTWVRVWIQSGEHHIGRSLFAKSRWDKAQAP